MADELAMQTIDRIERALARIEAASTRAAAADRHGNGDGDGELIQLREAHHSLRARVEGAIAQIDRLLEPGEGVTG